MSNSSLKIKRMIFDITDTNWLWNVFIFTETTWLYSRSDHDIYSLRLIEKLGSNFKFLPLHVDVLNVYFLLLHFFTSG